MSSLNGIAFALYGHKNIVNSRVTVQRMNLPVWVRLYIFQMNFSTVSVPLGTFGYMTDSATIDFVNARWEALDI